MQQFIDGEGNLYAFDDDVIVTGAPGSLAFMSRNGEVLSVPAGLSPYAAPTPSEAEQLAAAQAAKLAELDAAYAVAVTQPVSFTTAGGVAKTFQADKASQDTLTVSMQGYDIAGSVPAGFYWVAADNTLVPFTLDDLKGLYAAMLAQGWVGFQNRQTKKTAARVATTVAAVEAITWS